MVTRNRILCLSFSALFVLTLFCSISNAKTAPAQSAPQPAVATSPQPPDLGVVYTAVTNPGVYFLKYARVYKSTQSVQISTLYQSAALSGIYYPDISIDSNNDVHVIYSRYGNSRDFNYIKMTQDGSPLISETIPIPMNPLTDQPRGAAIAVNSGGVYAVVGKCATWLCDVYLAKRSSTGWRVENLFSTNTPNYQYGDGLNIVLEQQNGITTRAKIYYRQRNTNSQIARMEVREVDLTTTPWQTVSQTILGSPVSTINPVYTLSEGYINGEKTVASFVADPSPGIFLTNFVSSAWTTPQLIIPNGLLEAVTETDILPAFSFHSAVEQTTAGSNELVYYWFNNSAMLSRQVMGTTTGQYRNPTIYINPSGEMMGTAVTAPNVLKFYSWVANGTPTVFDIDSGGGGILNIPEVKIGGFR